MSRQLEKLVALAAAPPEAVLVTAARALARARGLEGARFERLALLGTTASEVDGEAGEALRLWFEHAPIESLGRAFELLLEPGGRKRSGSYYTPSALARQVTRAAFERRMPRSVCDPALGGGVFLLAAADELATRSGESRTCVLERLHGVDRSALAVAVTETALWLWCGDAELEPSSLRERLRVTDALEPGWEPEGGFDLVIGNPPWVAYAGRAAQPLEPAARKKLAARFRAFRGYPTLQGMFVERAAELAKQGVIALIVPSPLADLEGYRPVRAALGETHAPVEPLLELGQDAFEGVVQPCFVLVAEPGSGAEGGRPFRLIERQRATLGAAEVQIPAALARLAELPTLPRELFGELGFQSAGDVAKTLFLRAESPDERHTVPLLEGKRVSEFRVDKPALFLNPDPGVLSRARCRLRPVEDYRRARFVVRQTAKYPIAALYPGLPFRNTLLAGFEHASVAPALAVGLLNSTLYRALHLAFRRDARQAAFPQVKIAHLRALPRPPRPAPEVAELADRISREGSTPDARAELDRRVFDLFGLSESERAEVLRFAAASAPPKQPRHPAQPT